MISIGIVDILQAYDLSPGGINEEKMKTCLVLDLIDEIVEIKQLCRWQLYGYTGYIYDKVINKFGKIMVCIHEGNLDHESAMEWLKQNIVVFQELVEISKKSGRSWVEKEYAWNKICNDFCSLK